MVNSMRKENIEVNKNYSVIGWTVKSSQSVKVNNLPYIANN